MTAAVRIRRGRGYDAEAVLALQLRVMKLPAPVAQYQPAVEYGRKWAVDYAWPEPEYRLIVEIDGAPHRIKARFLEDQRKRLILQALGWTMLAFSPGMVRAGLAAGYLKQWFRGQEPDAFDDAEEWVELFAKHHLLKRGRL